MHSSGRSGDLDLVPRHVSEHFRQVEIRTYVGKVANVRFTDLVPVNDSEYGLEVVGAVQDSHYGRLFCIRDTILGIKTRFALGDNLVEKRVTGWEDGVRALNVLLGRLKDSVETVEFIIGRPKLDTDQEKLPLRRTRGQSRERRSLLTRADRSPKMGLGWQPSGGEAEPLKDDKRRRRKRAKIDSGDDADDGDEAEWTDSRRSYSASPDASLTPTRQSSRLRSRAARDARDAHKTSLSNPVDLLSDGESDQGSLVVTLSNGAEGSSSASEGAARRRSVNVIDNPKLDTHRMVEFRLRPSHRGFVGMLLRVLKPKELSTRRKRRRQTNQGPAMPVIYEIALGWGTAYISGACSDEQLFDLSKRSDSNPAIATYPSKKDTKGAITIRYSDFVRLNGDIYLNDTIVEAYLNYLKWDVVPRAMLEAGCPSPDGAKEELEKKLEELRKDVGQAVYVFSPFFHESLKPAMHDLDDLKRCQVKKGSEKYEREARVIDRLKRWHRGVDLLDRELLLIPVCEAMHWYLVAVFFPGEAAQARRTSCQLVDIAREVDVLRSNIEEKEKRSIADAKPATERSAFSVRVNSLCEDSEPDDVQVIHSTELPGAKKEAPPPSDREVVDLAAPSPGSPPTSISTESALRIQRRPKEAHKLLHAREGISVLDDSRESDDVNILAQLSYPPKRRKTFRGSPEELVSGSRRESKPENLDEKPENCGVKPRRCGTGSSAAKIYGRRSGFEENMAENLKKPGRTNRNDAAAHLSDASQNKTMQLIKSFDESQDPRSRWSGEAGRSRATPRDSLQHLREHPSSLRRAGGGPVGRVVDQVYLNKSSGRDSLGSRQRVQEARALHEEQKKREATQRWHPGTRRAGRGTMVSDRKTPRSTFGSDGSNRMSSYAIEVPCSSDEEGDEEGDEEDVIPLTRGEKIGGGRDMLSQRNAEAGPTSEDFSEASPGVSTSPRASRGQGPFPTPRNQTAKDFELLEEALDFQAKLLSRAAPAIAVFDSLNGVSPNPVAFLVRRYLNILYRHDVSGEEPRRGCEKVDDERLSATEDAWAKPASRTPLRNQRWRSDWPFDARTMPSYQVESPSQMNDTDCGCYLLKSAQKLLLRGVIPGEPKLSFGAFTLAMHRERLEPLGIDQAWFSRKDVRTLMAEMKRLLYDLKKDQEGANGGPSAANLSDATQESAQDAMKDGSTKDGIDAATSGTEAEACRQPADAGDLVNDRKLGDLPRSSRVDTEPPLASDGPVTDGHLCGRGSMDSPTDPSAMEAVGMDLLSINGLAGVEGDGWLMCQGNRPSSEDPPRRG